MTTIRTARTRASATAALALALALGCAAPAAQAHARTPAAATAAPATAPTTAADGVVLPRPTGAFPVGRSTLHLVDRARQDPWMPDRPRELMVDVRYPARSAAGDPAPYARPQEARALLEALGVSDPATVERLTATRTHSVPGARPQRGRHPLVLLSPGFGVPRYTLTTLAEDLASRGYVVATVDHAYEANGVVFPGGRVLTCVACTKAQTEEDFRAATEGRGRDLAFVLDRLTGPRPAWRYASVIDRRRIGAAGHSLGGAAAASVMRQDPRVRAGVNMDGSFGDPVPDGGLGGRPFLMLGTHEAHDGMHLPGGPDRTWDAAWHNLDGWKRWLTVTGSDHYTFSDGPVLFDQLDELPYPFPGEPGLPADHAVDLVRTYTAAFFDRHLRHRPQPLLDGPSDAYPEVHFQQPQ
ncbi:alpha/beta hydrolase [Streptomyces sp. CC53]|uniref:alpha/beta hydrolase family protein n=1 Tax=unclassified Streptomyces TaxID=2593676 RepID=UPI0008DE0A21|nr:MULTISPECIES: dienelactone hydrolase family protein [unclassified Streptomyces]OII65986.1 alpha/beta hydrolase [Streptomyces sp. CC53]